MPVDASVNITLLILRIPTIGNGVETTKAPNREGRKSGGATAFLQPGTGDDDSHIAASVDDLRLCPWLCKRS